MRNADDSLSVVTDTGGGARHVSAMAVPVLGLARPIAVLPERTVEVGKQVGVCEVDAGVQDGDPHAGAGEARIVGVGSGRVPGVDAPDATRSRFRHGVDGPVGHDRADIRATGQGGSLPGRALEDETVEGVLERPACGSAGDSCQAGGPPGWIDAMLERHEPRPIDSRLWGSDSKTARRGKRHEYERRYGHPPESGWTVHRPLCAGHPGAKAHRVSSYQRPTSTGFPEAFIARGQE